MRAGRRGCQKGKEFERQIARDLRQIYDPPELCKRIADATNADRKRCLSESCVRRGEQGRNAHEPDIVVDHNVAPCPWWFELETGGGGPMGKHKQARRDLELHQIRGGSKWSKAVAICHQLAAKHITATLTLSDLVATVNGDFDDVQFQDLPVTIDYQELLALLRNEHPVPGLNHANRS